MSNKLLLWIGAAVVVLAVLVWIGISFLGGSATQPSSNQASTTLPVAGSIKPGSYYVPGTVTSTPGLTTVKARSGKTLVTNDFLHNPLTISDPQNLGNYILAGSLGYCLKDGSCPAGAAASDFGVSYDANTRVFTIALTKEPIGQARTDSEQFLQKTLGISQTEMCDLYYYLGTTDSVNSFYGGQNLGFSFCPGAAALPQ